jgi:TatA/E family protein of Tat protein translocase
MSVFPSVAFLTGSVGTGEWIVLFVVILIVVGPKRLPEIARKIGRTMEMFRRAADEFKDQLMTMDQETPPPSSPSTTDADGVTQPDDSVVSDSYGDAYPNMSDYPGNEGQVENGSSESLAEPSVSASGGEEGASWVAQAESTGEPPAESAPDASPERPEEGGA